jgi:hypothetical protein
MYSKQMFMSFDLSLILTSNSENTKNGKAWQMLFGILCSCLSSSWKVFGKSSNMELCRLFSCQQAMATEI